MSKLSKKYLLISLTFNFVVLLSFLFFTFVYPALARKDAPDEKKYRYPLSASQKKSLDSLDRIYEEQELPFRIMNIQNRLLLWEKLMQSDPIDSTEIRRIMQDLKAGENQLKEIRYQRYLAEQYTLTPQQRIERLNPSYGRLKAYLEDLKRKQ